MQYAGSYTVAGLHLPYSVLSVILWRVPAMQSILDIQWAIIRITLQFIDNENRINWEDDCEGHGMSYSMYKG